MVFRLIDMKLDLREFLGSLITNITSELRNSKWQIQYGGSNMATSFQNSRFFALSEKNLV